MTSPPSDSQRRLLILAFNTNKKQWHYDTVELPQGNGWVTISEPCPEYQLQLFTYFLDFTPQRKRVSATAMKREWSRFKQWLHWLEACGIDCQAPRLPNYDKLPAVFEWIREQSRPAEPWH